VAWKKHDYDNIPGTYVFDGERAHPSYALNHLLYSLNEEDCRDEFEKDRVAYCDKFGVEGKYREAVLNDDFLGMLRMGANIYFMAKMAIPRGTSVQDAGAAFQGITTKEFQDKLFAHAENLEDKIQAKGDFWNG